MLKPTYHPMHIPPPPSFLREHEESILTPYIMEIQQAMNRIVEEGYYPKLEFLWDGKKGVEIKVTPMELKDE